MALSILSYNLLQGLKMSASNSSSSGLCASSPTSDENSPVNVGTIGNGRTTISLGKSFSRITMQNVLSESSGNALNISNNGNVNTIVRKIKDFGMYGKLHNAGTLGATIGGRKRTTSELATAKLDDKTYESKAEKPKIPSKRQKLSDKVEKTREKPSKSAPTKSATTNSHRLKPNTPGVKKPAGTPGRKGLPLPLAVARRNARERNRVKQVNNGFAALRERIPEEVAEAFEAHGNGRCTVKKLSKVETLRMAVEYIRNLECLLGFNFPIGSDRGLTGLLQGCSSSDESFTFVKDEFDALSPPLDETNFDDTLSNYDVDEYLNSSDFGSQMISQSNFDAPDAGVYETDMLPNLTTINGMQYVRIPGTNTYQLLTPDALSLGNVLHSPPNSSMDDESFQTLIDTNCLSPVATTSSPHISPSSATSIKAAPAMVAVALQQHSAIAPPNGETVGECVNVAVGRALSRSPVQSSPTMRTSLHQAQPQQQREHHKCEAQTPMRESANLSPADNDTLLLQTCATTSATASDDVDGNEGNTNDRTRFVALPTPTTLSLQPPHTIKKEFADTLTDFIPSNLSAGAMVFQQQLQERLLLSHAPMSTMSPPLERCNSRATPTNGAPTPTLMFVPSGATTPITPGLPSFYSAAAANSYYESANIILKKDYDDALLEVAATTTANDALGGLHDENIIEVMDWWEGHTPKSDGGVSLL